MKPGIAHLINIFSPEMLGTQLAARFALAASNLAFPANNDAILVPLCLPYPALVKRLYIGNGNAAGQNVDVGIYTADFTLITSIGSTAQTGNSVPQFFDIADKWLSPAQYYVAVASNSTSSSWRRVNVTIAHLPFFGMAKMATAFPLPATITPASITAAFVPLVGLEIGGTLI